MMVHALVQAVSRWPVTEYLGSVPGPLF